MHLRLNKSGSPGLSLALDLVVFVIRF